MRLRFAVDVVVAAAAAAAAAVVVAVDSGVLISGHSRSCYFAGGTGGNANYTGM